jgi:hypothetical protein
LRTKNPDSYRDQGKPEGSALPIAIGIAEPTPPPVLFDEVNFSLFNFKLTETSISKKNGEVCYDRMAASSPYKLRITTLATMQPNIAGI